MPLSEDQRALLRLLAQREEGYEDIAALKGIGVEQIRAEVREALAALDAPPPEPPPPPPAAPAPSPAPERAAEPEPGQPPAPSPQSPPPAEKKKPARPRAGWPGISVPAERRRLLLLSGGALAIVAIVLGAIALIGGGDSGSSPDNASSPAGTELAAGEEGKVTQAVLSPPDGGDAGGRAVFGRVDKDEIVLQVTAENLEPTEQGESYTVWLYRNPKLALRVGKVPVESGRLGARFPIPSELLAYVASGAFNQIYLSRTTDAAYQREVARAKKNNAIPRYVGDTVLSGEITGPIAKAAAGQGN